jgi:Restriction endonuclease
VDSEQYEQLVAALLVRKGWSAEVTPRHDKGLDVIAHRAGERLGVQAKMWAGANRALNAECVMVTYAACTYFDCEQRMVATDAKVLGDAEAVAKKLGVEIWHVPAEWPADVGPVQPRGLSFGTIWSNDIPSLRGEPLRRDDGSTNEIISVDAAYLVRRTSNGKTQQIKAETFRWAVDQLLAGETVLREEINDHCVGRASSGVLLILSALPYFERTTVGRKEGLRLARDPSAST